MKEFKTNTRGHWMALRWIALAAMCVVVAQVILAPRAQAQDPAHGEELRQQLSLDEVTSATLALKALEKEREAAGAAEKGILTFNLLRGTKLNRKPPPIYPEPLANLDGKKAKITGFMSPYDSLKDMHLFMLVPQPTGCFFCAPPSPREVVFVRQKDGAKDHEFMDAPIEVEGTLKLWKEDSDEQGHEMFLYVIDQAVVREASLDMAGASSRKN